MNPEQIDGKKITVLVEPTDAMLRAALDWSYKIYGKPIGDDAARGCWKAMIEAARQDAA